MFWVWVVGGEGVFRVVGCVVGFSWQTLMYWYARVYDSWSSSSVGRLYASRLLMSWCPNIWSIQFVFTPAASRLVWRYFLRLWADMFDSLIL